MGGGEGACKGSCQRCLFLQTIVKLGRDASGMRLARARPLRILLCFYLRAVPSFDAIYSY